MATRASAVAESGVPAPADAARLVLLGGFELRLDTGAVELYVSAQRVLAFLALRGRTGRSRLAGTLWPEVTEDKALASLRTALWRVQQVGRGLVTTTPNDVDLADGVFVDAQEVISSSRLLLHGGVDHLSLWWSSVRFQGELLPDWSDDWLVVERERLRQLRLHALERLAERWTAQGSHGLALEAALAALRADPLRETAHRAAIMVHLAEGNLGEAIRQFERCREVLLEEFGVEPTPATVALLRSHQPPTVT
jgi:DNA-binding SARP family transcriptional activator